MSVKSQKTILTVSIFSRGEAEASTQELSELGIKDGDLLLLTRAHLMSDWERMITE